MKARITLFLTASAIALLLFNQFVPLRNVSAAGVVGAGTPESCNEAALDAALTVGGDITFNCGPNPAFITLTGAKTISKDTSLDGNKKVTLSADDKSRIFVVQATGALTLSQLTLSDGNAVDSDKATKDGNGGAIWNQGGSLTLQDTMITDSNAAHNGGAIFSEDGKLMLKRVSIFRNKAENGGALYVAGGTADLGNVTFSLNEASDTGGAVYNDKATVMMAHNTLDINKAAKTGADVFTDDLSDLTLANTIVANPQPTDGSKPIDICSGKFVDGKNNLQFPSKTCGETVEVNAPLLAPLANYGGYVWTQALKSGSPAIDRADAAACKADPVTDMDARKFNRPIGAACDIGAYEFQQAKPTAIPPTAAPAPPQSQPGNPPPPHNKPTPCPPGYQGNPGGLCIKIPS